VVTIPANCERGAIVWGIQTLARIAAVGAVRLALEDRPSRLGPWSYRSTFAFDATLSAGTKEPARKTGHTALMGAAAEVYDWAAAEGSGRVMFTSRSASAPSIVVLDAGTAKALTTTTVQNDIYAVFFDQKGLMAGLGLQGSKISRLDK
jgi:hypothetical protein